MSGKIGFEELNSELSGKIKSFDIASLETINNKIVDLSNHLGNLEGLPTQNKLDIVSAISELFQYVSNGKSLVASAVTDKGIITSINDTFTIIASNILKIQTGENIEDKIILVDALNDKLDTDINYNMNLLEIAKIIKQVKLTIVKKSFKINSIINYTDYSISSNISFMSTNSLPMLKNISIDTIMDYSKINLRSDI